MDMFSSKGQATNILGIGQVELDKNEKIREVINLIHKYKAQCDVNEELLKTQESLKEKLEVEMEKLKKDLDSAMNQNKELKKRVVSFRNTCDGYEELINNSKLDITLI